MTSDLRERGDNPDTYGVTWSITQPLWRSGAVSAGIRYAELYSASTDEAIRRQVQDTVVQATEEFLGVLLAQQMVNVYTESAAVAERMLETAQKKRNAGSASDYEVLRAEVEVASTRAALIKERNALRSKVIRLLMTMGVNQDSDITLVGSLAYVPEGFEFASLVQTALVNRPDLLQAEAALRMADEQLRAVKGSYGPSADAFINGKYLLIETGGFGRDMLRSAQVKDSIKNIVKQISGIDCRLGPYTPSGAVQYNLSENKYRSDDTHLASAEKIMQRAQEAGVDVEED